MKANKTLEFRLTAGDLDVYDHLTPYTISNLFQEAASLHAEELNVGYEIMKEKDLAWIVARNKITIIDPINVVRAAYIINFIAIVKFPYPNALSIPIFPLSSSIVLLTVVIVTNAATIKNISGNTFPIIPIFTKSFFNDVKLSFCVKLFWYISTTKFSN